MKIFKVISFFMLATEMKKYIYPEKKNSNQFVENSYKTRNFAEKTLCGT